MHGDERPGDEPKERDVPACAQGEKGRDQNRQQGGEVWSPATANDRQNAHREYAEEQDVRKRRQSGRLILVDERRDRAIGKCRQHGLMEAKTVRSAKRGERRKTQREAVPCQTVSPGGSILAPQHLQEIARY